MHFFYKKKNLNRHPLIQFLGWYGVAAILFAYALLTLGVLTSHAVWYQLLNLTGAIGLVLDGYVDRDYQPMTLNLIWTAVALFGLISLLV